MKVVVTVESKLTFKIDENSNEFKNLFENYKKYFQDCVDEAELMEHITKQILQSPNGILTNIEGVGEIDINGFSRLKQGSHPINIINDNPDYSYPKYTISSEIVETKKIK